MCSILDQVLYPSHDGPTNQVHLSLPTHTYSDTYIQFLFTGHFSKSQTYERVIALSHYDVTIKTFIKILFNARDHGRLEGTKQRKFTENLSKNRINSRREVE